MPDKTRYFECQCYSPEHTMHFHLFDNGPNELPEMYTDIFLSQPNGFFKRIWIAIKYVLGYKCKYGHFDCFLWREDDMAGLVDIGLNYHTMIQKYRMEQQSKSECQCEDCCGCHQELEEMCSDDCCHSEKEPEDKKP